MQRIELLETLPDLYVLPDAAPGKRKRIAVKHCVGCGTRLNAYNRGDRCWPCEELHEDELFAKIDQGVAFTPLQFAKRPTDTELKRSVNYDPLEIARLRQEYRLNDCAVIRAFMKVRPREDMSAWKIRCAIEERESFTESVTSKRILVAMRMLVDRGEAVVTRPTKRTLWIRLADDASVS